MVEKAGIAVGVSFGTGDIAARLVVAIGYRASKYA